MQSPFDPYVSKLKVVIFKCILSQISVWLILSCLFGEIPLTSEEWSESRGPQSQAVWGVVEEGRPVWRREVLDQWEGGLNLFYILLEVRTRMKGSNIVKQRTNMRFEKMEKEKSEGS